MFYAHIVLAKKGPLAKIWLAAHWDKKLTKAHVFETNIEQSIEGIMHPKVKLALRTSGHLLLGVVRIYSRKAKYLLADCNEAFVKIKMAFRPGVVDLPEEHRESAANAVTLPEIFHDFDTGLPELHDVDVEAQFAINQSRVDEITMREEYGSMPLHVHDDGFGDIRFEDDDVPDMMDDGLENVMGNDFFSGGLDEGIDMKSQKDDIPAPPESMDGDFDDGISDRSFEEPAAALFEGDLFGESNSVEPPAEPISETIIEKTIPIQPEPDPDTEPITMPSSIYEQQQLPEAEIFALAPIDSTFMQGFNTKSKRKRKLIVDEVLHLSGEEIKNQLANTSDIVTTLDIAPPTKRLMFWKETGGVEKLFALPSRDFTSKHLSKLYNRHLVSISVGVEDFTTLGPSDLLVAERPIQEDVAAKRRKKDTPQIDSILEPEPIRQNEEHGVSNISIAPGIDKTKESFMSAAEIFQPMQGSFTPSGLDHGGITPRHYIEHMDSIPDLHVDQVSSILDASAIESFEDIGGTGRTIEGISRDWDNDFEDDFEQPIETVPEDEQGVDETAEQFEERVLNKRAAQLFVTVRKVLNTRDTLALNDLTIRVNRKQAAQKFYSLLVLKKFQVLNLEQSEPYSPITISKGTQYENPKL